MRKDVQITGVCGKIGQDRQSEDGSDAWRDFIEHDPDPGWGWWEDYKEVHKRNDDRKNDDESTYDTNIIYRCKELFKAVKYRELVKRKEQGEISQDLFNEMLKDVS